MALRLDYLTRETGQNLVRNPLTAIAIVTTVAVSLTMAAATLLLSAGVDSAFEKWNNDVSFIVYVNPQATNDQIQSLDKDLKQSPQVSEVSYLDHAASFDEFKRLFKDEPTIVSTVKAEDLPTSFRVKPTNTKASVIDQLADQYKVKAGVMKVDFPTAAVRAVQRSFSSLKLFLFTGSIALLMASFLLIFNSIQTAVFARRREIEVMKLVGATNWFIRVPFIVEGFIQGVVGALFSWFALLLFQRAWHSQFSNTNPTPTLFDNIQWSSGDFRLWVIVTFVVGALVGSVASFISTTWYLRV